MMGPGLTKPKPAEAPDATLERWRPIIEAAKALRNASLGMGVKNVTAEVKRLVETVNQQGE